MKEQVEHEIVSIIQNLSLDCTIEEFRHRTKETFRYEAHWDEISQFRVLSDDFIKEFNKELNWGILSKSQKLSEDLIRKFRKDVDWYNISQYQKMSEDFIREFEVRVNWHCLAAYQSLSEAFVEEFEDRVYWNVISRNQKLSENFIRRFKDKVGWLDISASQPLSKAFIEEFKDDIRLDLQEKRHKLKSAGQKKKEMREYAEKYNLEFDGKFLYAFRNHDIWGRGLFNKTISYSKGDYHKDWHCDMDETCTSSFGLGIYPEGNTPIKVRVEDWGCAVMESKKGRVFGIEVI